MKVAIKLRGLADDFAALARPGQTLAVYMGVVTLPALVAGLVSHGLDPSTPAALVERGGTAEARTLRATLGTVLDGAAELGVDLMGAGTHPFASWSQQQLTEGHRYAELINRTQRRLDDT